MAANPLAGLVSFLKAQVGKAYQSGANGPDAWNCSSLVAAAYRNLGINMPAYTYAAVKYGESIDPTKQGLQPGDLIYVNGDGGRDYGHVMVYIGGGQVIQAANTKTGVIQSAVPNVQRIQAVRRMVDSNGALIDAPGAVLADHASYVPVVASANASTAPSVPLYAASGNQDPNQAFSDIATGFTTTDTGTTTDPVALAKQLYPYLAAYLDDPTIGPILKDAAAQKLSPDQLLGQLQATDWWKTTSATAREFDAKQKTDPASAQADIAAAEAQISSEALQLGLDADPAHIHEIAVDSVRLGWNDAQLRKVLGAEANKNPAEIAQTQLANLTSMAGDYGLKYSPDQLQKWASDIIGGTATAQQFQSNLIDVASGKYPTISDALAKGTTLRAYMDPYVQQMAGVLGISANSVDLSDSKWTNVLSAPGPDGKPRPMTLQEATNYARQNPAFGWSKTADAQKQAADFATRLGVMFGKAA